MRKNTHPTYTNVVLEYLRGLDDFATVDAIHKATRVTKRHITSALGSLKGYRCVDCVIADGRLWWFAEPPEKDTRSRVYLERAEETRPRKRKRKVSPA